MERLSGKEAQQVKYKDPCGQGGRAFQAHRRAHGGFPCRRLGPAKVFDVSGRYGAQHGCMMHQILPAGPRDLRKLPRWGGSCERNWGLVRLEARLVNFRLLEESR